MDLSVIIVSYNVRAFLEKCLISARSAMKGISGEIIVVDNASFDDSAAVVRDRFPDVHLVVNNENVGFSRANNIGIRAARGEFVLILNPDTVVSEDTFRICLEFMRARPEAGAVGVRMFDGSGSYLPESKRGLPSPAASFFKVTGINRLFPKSGFFNRYYMGGLDPNEVNKVEVLTGAFMFIRKAVLDEVGPFDEDFFMYGEDIDLSYRILKAGYAIYYLPETSIIHYKGESTKRSSITYVRTFYDAMLIFLRKHYKGPKGAVLRYFLALGIVLRGFLSGVHRLLSTLFLPAADIALIYFSILIVTRVWAAWYYDNPGHFDWRFYSINLPLYTGLWFLVLLAGGEYERDRSVRRTVISVCAGGVLVLFVYSLLDAELRSSRAVILMSTVMIALILSLWTALYSRLKVSGRRERIAVVGSPSESWRIMELINRISPEAVVAGSVAVREDDRNPQYLGELSQLGAIVKAHRLSGLIFASSDLTFSDINKWMAALGPKLRYHIASSESSDITGSHSSKSPGNLYTSEIEFRIDRKLLRRNKRLFDILIALMVFLGAPVAIFSKGWRRGLADALRILRGKLTWVSYNRRDGRLDELPWVRSGVVPITKSEATVGMSEREIHMLNYIYAREYSVWRDVERLLFSPGEIFSSEDHER